MFAALRSRKNEAALAESVTAATAVVLLMNLLSKVLGFVREMAVARVFGATMYTDAYLVAYTLPYSAQQIIGWAIVSVTVPLLTKYIVDGKSREANLAANSFLNSTALLMLIVSLLGVVFAPLLVKVTAPSLERETALLAIKMTRIMFPSVFFVCIGMVLTGILNARRRFAVGAFAPAFSSIIIIAAVIFAGGRWGIYGLAAGTLLSFVGFLLIQLPSTLATGYRYTLQLPRSNPEVKAALASLVPIILGMSVNQIYYILNRVFASGLAQGSISSLNYAAKLAQFPAGVFVLAIAVAVYPSLTEYALKGDLQRFREALEKGLGVVLLLAAPAAVGLAILRVPIVRLLFEGGAFTAADTLNTASALLFYTGGIVAYSLILVLIRVFFAFRDVKTPVFAGLLGIGANVAVSFLTVKTMGHNGLALATSVGSIVNMLVFFALLKKHLPAMTFGPLLLSILKIAAATAFMGVAVYRVSLIFGHSSDWLSVLTGIGVGVAVYLCFVFLLRLPEGAWLKEKLLKKRGFKRKS